MTATATLTVKTGSPASVVRKLDALGSYGVCYAITSVKRHVLKDTLTIDLYVPQGVEVTVTL